FRDARDGSMQGVDHGRGQRVPLLRPIEGDGADLILDAGLDEIGHQNRSFSARTAANRATGSPGARSDTRARTEAASSGLSGRRNGFVAFSSPIVLGTVNRPSRLRACTRASLSASPRFPGSTSD